MSGVGPCPSLHHPHPHPIGHLGMDLPWPGPIASGVSVDGSSASSTHRVRDFANKN